MKIETLAVQARGHDDTGSGAIVPPLSLSTTFERDADNNLLGAHIYSRNDNPNRHSFEQACATLEGGAAAAAFASGQAATMGVLHALAAGDHLIAPADIYYGTRALIETHYSRWGLQASFVDTTDPAQIAAALRPNTKLVWIETPSNPRLRITDIAAAAAIAHGHGALLVCDNTWATPVLTRPFEFDADLVMHSTTKYFGGHSDVLSGCIVTKREDDFFERVRGVQVMGGAVASAFDCWMLLRSLPTMPYRVRIQAETALAVARFLAEHPRITTVHYPGLKHHAGHEIAARQMSLFGGMLSIEVAGSGEEAIAFAGRLRLFKRATSLGGVESLIEHRATTEGPTSTTPPTLLRLSIGLEHVDDLIVDLDQALNGQ